MEWPRLLAYITGRVDKELLVRNEYLAAENRILRAKIKGRLQLSDGEKRTLAEIAHRPGPTCSLWKSLPKKVWSRTTSCSSSSWRHDACDLKVFSNPRMSLKEGESSRPMGLLSNGLGVSVARTR